MSRVGSAVLKVRYLVIPRGMGYEISTAFGTAGRCFLTPIDVPWPVLVDRIIVSWVDIATGSVRVGIYREGSTADSPKGGALVVESSSTDITGTLRIQSVAIAKTALTPGLYFVGVMGSETTSKPISLRDEGASMAWYYDRTGGYGGFTDPCPTVTAHSRLHVMGLRVAENLPAGYRL